MKAITAARMVGARLGKAAPLAVSWAVTGRCNLRCAYCNIWSKRFNELTTAEAMKAATEIASAGTARVSLTGGEPLLRDDIGRIITALKEGATVSMNSNGTLVKKRISEVMKLDRLSLSVDGPETVHDSLRGDGAYAKVMEAAAEASGRGVRTSFLAVMTKGNLLSLHELMDDAQRMGIKVLLQPAETYTHSSSRAGEMRPSPAELRHFFKEAPRKAIMNSSACIREFIRPSITPANCAAGRVICRIAPDGSMLACGRSSSKKDPDVRDGFVRGFMSLGQPACEGCFCAGNVEASLLFRMDPNALSRFASVI